MPELHPERVLLVERSDGRSQHGSGRRAQSVAMRISGHKTAAVFRRYDVTTEDDIREAMRRTQAHIAAQAPASNIRPLSGEGRA